jgi:hypothetical protein
MWEICLRGESPHGGTIVPERGMLGVARPGPVKSWNTTKSKLTEEIVLNFDASFQQILSSDSEFLWESRSMFTLAVMVERMPCAAIMLVRTREK